MPRERPSLNDHSSHSRFPIGIPCLHVLAACYLFLREHSLLGTALSWTMVLAMVWVIPVALSAIERSGSRIRETVAARLKTSP